MVEILSSLGGRPVATQLLEQVRAEAEATPDDMAACILAPQDAGERTYTHVEELEADARALGSRQVSALCKETGS